MRWQTIFRALILNVLATLTEMLGKEFSGIDARRSGGLTNEKNRRSSDATPATTVPTRST